MRKKNKSANRAGDEKEEFSLIPHATLLELYEDLLQCTAPRSGANRLTKEWRFEGAAIALAKTLVANDTVIAGRKSAGMRLLSQVAGKNRTPVKNRVIVMFGDGGNARGWEALLEVARARRLPFIFVADARDRNRRGKRSARSSEAGLKPGTELPHIVVDGNDVVASYRVAHEAVDRARRGRGPTLIECVSFHVSGRKHRDPVAMMESYLRSKGLYGHELRPETPGAVRKKPRNTK